MIIIGINGLGVLPSAAIIQDNKIIAFAEEERFTRKKGSDGLMPISALKYCLEEAKISLKDVDYITFGWNANLYLFQMPLFFLKKIFFTKSKIAVNGSFQRVIKELWKYNPLRVRFEIKKMFKSAGCKGKLPTIKFISHHLSHAASAYYCSGFNESLILVVDGSGEFTATSIYHGVNQSITKIKSFDIPNSIGWYYQSLTEYLGFQPNNHEGKVMALAAYGNYNDNLIAKIRLILDSKDDGSYFHESLFSYTGTHTKSKVYSDELVELLGPARLPKQEITQYYKDIAFATQLILEETCLKILEPFIQSPEFSGNLCIAGGVGLNCKMNGVLAQQSQVKKIFVPPYSGDNGCALGSAMYLMSKLTMQSFGELKHAYWGPSIQEENIEKLLDDTGLVYERHENITSIAANLLAQGNVLAWCNGRMEVGSRALGHRSILANPSKIDTRDFINTQIKSRETWRPFAASILEEFQEKYLYNKSKAPFMTQAFRATDLFLKIAPAAIHIDGTTRPQIVCKNLDSQYWELIKSFGELTGVYAVLNTSFNLNEEPIVCTIEDAIRTFLKSKIEVLIIESYIIYK